MKPDTDVIDLAWKAGEAICVHARGNPALIVTGLVVTGCVIVGVGSYRLGRSVFSPSLKKSHPEQEGTA